MTEFLSNTHQPGQDGQKFGTSPDQGVLYSWMRVLAGGGVSQFSEVRMRGPLTLADGSLVTGARAFESFADGNFLYDCAVLPQVKPANAQGATTSSARTSGGLALVAGDTVVLRNSSGANIPWSLATVTLNGFTTAVPAGGNVISLYLEQGGVVVPGLEAQAALTPSVNSQTFTLTGQVAIANWANTQDITVFVGCSAVNATTFVIQNCSVNIEAIA